jgi:hypothetical protein
MRNKKWSALAIGFLTLLGLSNEAQAMPMFGKQTGLDCTACHLQHMPKLNSVGRSFAASGMTQGKKNSDVNSSGVDLNPSVMFKSIYEKTWDKPDSQGRVKADGTNDGEHSIPRTATLYVGGKVSDNVGAIVDLMYKDLEDNTIGGKVVYAKEFENGYLGLSAYSASSFGPFSGMEFYNTGLYKPLRSFDIKKLSNAFLQTGIPSGPATGVQIYYDNDGVISSGDRLFGTMGIYTPAQDNAEMNMASNTLPFVRIAYEYPIGDFNVMIGAFGISGGSKVSTSNELHTERETYGMDLQIEGDIFDKSVAFSMGNVFHNKVTYTGRGAGLTEDSENVYNDAFSIDGEVNLTPDFGIKVAYMRYDDRYSYFEENNPSKYIDVKDLDYAITVGMDYSFKIYLPMKVAVEHAWAKPSLDRVESYRDFIVTLNILY